MAQFVEHHPPSPPAMMPEFFQSLDVLLLPSRFESFGLTYVEAMACGLPVIASRLGGHQMSVVDGQTGLLFEPGNVGDLADKLGRLLDDPELRWRLGQAARERATAEFSWPVIIERHYFNGVLAT